MWHALPVQNKFSVLCLAMSNSKAIAGVIRFVPACHSAQSDIPSPSVSACMASSTSFVSPEAHAGFVDNNANVIADQQTGNNNVWNKLSSHVNTYPNCPELHES